MRQGTGGGWTAVVGTEATLWAVRHGREPDRCYWRAVPRAPLTAEESARRVRRGARRQRLGGWDNALQIHRSACSSKALTCSFAAIRAAAATGALLGAISRIGFWLWYAVPLGALLSGQVMVGALLYGTYGFVRSAVTRVVIRGPARRVGGNTVAMWMLRQGHTARVLAAGQLALLGIGVAVAVGF